MGFCTRCHNETTWRARCTNCGTVYCDRCSTLSDKDISEGRKPYLSCCSEQCPSCNERAGKNI